MVEEQVVDPVEDNNLIVSKVKIPTSQQSLQPSSWINGTIGQTIKSAKIVAVSPDGKRGAIGSRDGEVILFEPIAAETNQSDSPQPPALRILQGPKVWVHSLVFSADSSVLLVLWRSDTLMAFDAKDGRKLHECKTPDGLRDCAISTDGKRIAIAGRFGWKVIDLLEEVTNSSQGFPKEIEKEEFTSSNKIEVSSINFSCDGTLLAVGVYAGEGMGCYVYNSKGTKPLETYCQGERVWKVILSPNSMILAIGCLGKVHLYNVASGDCFKTFRFEGEGRSIVFSKDGKRLFFCTLNGKMVYGYGIYSGQEEIKVQCPFLARHLDLWNDNTLLVACDEPHIQLIDVSMECTAHETKYEKDVYCSAISPNGQVRAFSFGPLEGLGVHDASEDKLNMKFDVTASTVCVSPCGKTIVFTDHGKIHVYKKATENATTTFEKTIKLDSPHWRSKVMSLEGGRHIFLFRKGTKTAQVINIDTGVEVPITTNILTTCIVPHKNMFAIATKDSITFHSNEDGSLKSDLTYSLSSEKDNGALAQAMKIPSDGSRLFLCFGSHLNIYNFDSDQGGVDSSSKLSIDLPLQNNKEVAIQDMAISEDGKIIAICEKKYVYTLSLEQEDEIRQVHQFPIGTIVSLAFLPQSPNDDHYCLFVTYGKYSTTLQVNAKKGVIDDPSLLLRCFAVCDDESMTALIPEHQALLYKRDEWGRTLAELAINDDRPAVLGEILKVEPSMAWSSLEVVKYLLERSKEYLVEGITIEKSCAFTFTDPKDLEKISNLLPILVKNGSIDIIYFLLNAGSPNCASGFVPGAKMNKKAFLNYRGLFRWLSYLLLVKGTPSNGSQVIPVTSKHPNNLEMYDEYSDDEQKSILLNACRVFLPYLSSYEILQALIDIDLNSADEDENLSKNVIPQRLKPFRSESLQASIEAAWYSWAGPMFFRRALCYVLWMVCIICLDYTSITELKIAYLIGIGFGWVYYFFIVELRQWRQKTSNTQYFYNFWNLWQVSTLILVLAYICLNIVDVIMTYLSRTSILCQENWKWFPGLVHLFTIINFVYFFRGMKRASWILYSLGVLIKKMIVFVFILLWIIVAACFQLTKVTNAFDTEQPIHVFTETYVTAIFGAFDSAEFCPNPYIAAASRGVLILFIILTLLFAVFMNAMIAFISEEFANILDYQAAILAREMACLIVDMYDSMAENDIRRQKEEQHKWVYKLFKQADLDKMGSDHTDAQADGRRATKQDIVKLKKENSEIKKEITEVRNEIAEVRNENAETRSSLEKMEKEMKSIKSGVETMLPILLAMAREST